MFGKLSHVCFVGRLNPNPPTPEKHLEPEAGDTLPDDIAELAYEKYLREVTRILQDDPSFKAKMNNATREDVMTGKLADELEFAHHTVRTKLDEAKRREVDRLRTDFRELSRLENKERAVHPEYIKTMTAHLSQPKDPKFADSFTKDDLQALIRKATADLGYFFTIFNESFYFITSLIYSKVDLKLTINIY